MKSSALLEEASRLEIAERIELVEAIWETLSADPQALPVSPDHQEELDRRLADIEANPEVGSSWAEVRGRLERRGRFVACLHMARNPRRLRDRPP